MIAFVSNLDRLKQLIKITDLTVRKRMINEDLLAVFNHLFIEPNVFWGP